MSAVFATPSQPAVGPIERARRRAPTAIHLLTAYIFVVPFGSSIELPGVRPAAIGTLSSLLGAATAAGLIGVFVLLPHRRARVPTIVFGWLAFLGWSALSYAWSVNPGGTASGAFVLTSLILTSVAIVMIRYTASDLEQFELALIVSGLVTGLIGLGQLLTGHLSDTGIGVGRFALVGDDANITAAALLLPAAAAINLWLNHVGSRRIRLLAAAGAVSSIFGIALTVSRGGMLALLVVVILLLVRRYGLKRAALICAVIGVALLIANPVGDRGASSTGRSSIWGIAVLSCDDYCWFGSGWDTFPDVHEQFVLERPELGILELRYEPHNLWLGTLVELGFVATLVLAMIALAAVASSMFTPTRFGVTTSIGMFSILVANLFVENVEFKYFWIAVAAATIAGAPRLEVARNDATEGRVS